MQVKQNINLLYYMRMSTGYKIILFRITKVECMVKKKQDDKKYLMHENKCHLIT